MLKMHDNLSKIVKHAAAAAVIGTLGLGVAWFGRALAHTVVHERIWTQIEARASNRIKDAGLRSGEVAVAEIPKQAFDPAPLSAPPPLVAPAQPFRALSPQAALAENDAVPLANSPNPPAAPFRLIAATAADRARALDCLTAAVYYESDSESDAGEAAVAQVVLNRVRHSLFPRTVCGVVLQGSELAAGCQFTFACDGSLSRPPSATGWKRARRVAERALNGYVQKDVGEATHYHTIWVVPYWQRSVVKLAKIGAHIFYRWPGDLGQPMAFHGSYAGLEPRPPSIPGFTDDTSPVLARVSPPVVTAHQEPALQVSLRSVAPEHVAEIALQTVAAPEIKPNTPTANGNFAPAEFDPDRLRPNLR